MKAGGGLQYGQIGFRDGEAAKAQRTIVENRFAGHLVRRDPRRLQRVAVIDAAARAVAATLPPDPGTITGEGVADPVAPLPADVAATSVDSDDLLAAGGIG